MQEFYASRREDGLIETHFPVPFRVVCIPQFSLYWILMIYDHMMYFGDKVLVKRYLGTVDGIFDYFNNRIDERGLVGQFDPEMWPFVDWVKEWQGTQGLQSMGIPPAYRRGAATYNSLIYAITLNYAAELCVFIGRFDTATEYRQRATYINDAVNQYCYDGETYLDGPDVKDRCQHTQIFAVLSNAVTGSKTTDLIRRTIVDKTLPQCSYAMSFYVFRAVEKVGLYTELFSALLEPWGKMMRNNLTTWAEDNDVMFRSDCHAWSSSPIYEMVKNVFGLYPTKPGYSAVRVKPNLQILEKARGTFVTAEGEIDISWEKGKYGTELVLESTVDMTIDLEFGDNSDVCELKKERKLKRVIS
jgi:alpha-L-rhamnosidase